MKTHVVSTFFRRPWGKGWRNLSHTFGPYTEKEANRVKQRMVREVPIKAMEKKGWFVHIHVEPLRNEDNEFGANL